MAKQFGPWSETLRTMGWDSSVFKSQLPFGHFGLGAEVSGQFRPTQPVPKCVGSELSWV